ncbi:MAG: asparagine synthase (glutamine-hydrolyzing) [Candidatus Acidiferrales bacterium]
MCGICGVVEWGGSRTGAAAREGEIARMLDCLIHRGPDGLGVDSRGPATLGAVRLAIRGLEDGRQPIVDEENGILAVCNGEIDNHLELKQWLASRGRNVDAATDVAVLPGLFLELGASFVERLVGAFAIGLWSERDGVLLLARDRAGERPLHVIVSERGAQFASELAALAAGAREPLAADTQALRGYLSAGFFPAPHDPFRGVRRVAPGELLEISKNGIRNRRYWTWKIGATSGSTSADGKNAISTHSSPKELSDEFDGVLRRAVGRQSEVDVPYGVFLSGGLDSSLVAAVLRRLRPGYRLAAFAIKFAEASYDESEHAQHVAAALGVELHRVEVGPAALPGTIAELVASSGEPLADPAWVPTALLARRAAQDVKIALVGEGADELFGGYPTYIGAGIYDRYARLPAWVRGAVRWGVERWPVADKKVTLSFLLKRFVQGEGLDAVARHLLWTSTISPQVMERLGVPVTEMRCADLAIEANDAASGDAPRDSGVLDRLQRLDLENSLAEGLLTKADRASMRYAIELRAPYLDVDVMEFAARLPAKERVRGFETKVFLKRFAERYLPASTVHRRKRGLSVPLARWLREPLYDWARARLDAEWLESAGVRPGAAIELLQEHRQRRHDFSRALWTLIVLSEWIEWASRRGDGSHESHAPISDARPIAQPDTHIDAKSRPRPR